MRSLPILLASLIVVVVLIVALRPFLSDGEDQARAQLLATSPLVTGFSRVEGPQPLVFPAAHGPHPDYETEWWYYTGNLETDDGRQFGFQLTFFRRALLPPAQRQGRSSRWATDQVYLAHFALTDVAGGHYRAFERFSRGAASLAGALAEPYRVWLEDWNVEETTPDAYQLRATQDGLALDLTLSDEKGPILQGDRGYSQKGPEAGNASIYYSLTRLASSGTVRVDDATYQVNGWSWMDHEFSTSALAPDQVGWDWFSLQLDDGSELMVFQLRKVDGSVDPFSSGALVAPDGTTTPLSRDDFHIGVKESWTSSHSGATYPSAWTVNVPNVELTLELLPHMADQELNVSYAYWEGAVRITGERAGKAVSGNGYVELTGYAASMQNQF